LPVHMFASERPRLAGTIPTLLRDGSAIPALLLRPEEDGTVTVYVNVRVQEPGTQYYTQAALRALPPKDASALLEAYIADPEGVLALRFGWKDATRHVPNRTTPPKAPAPSEETKALIDLL
jgi:hypothetical protein